MRATGFHQILSAAWKKLDQVTNPNNLPIDQIKHIDMALLLIEQADLDNTAITAITRDQTQVEVKVVNKTPLGQAFSYVMDFQSEKEAEIALAFTRKLTERDVPLTDTDFQNTPSPRLLEPSRAWC